jgi:hypothetical protein
LAAKKDFIVGADINMFKELAASGREGVRGMVGEKRKKETKTINTKKCTCYTYDSFFCSISACLLYACG